MKDDSQVRFNTFRTFLSEEVFQEFEAFCLKASFGEMNKKAVSLLKEKHKKLIKWLAAMPSFFETDTQIFVHAGLAEEAGFHDIYYDGMSHYYIDGSVYEHGKLLLMAYDEEKRKYYQVENGRKITINSMI